MADPAWIQIAHQQGETYIKGATNLLFRKRIIFARLKAAGRVSVKDGGYDIRWKADIREPNVNTVSGFEQIEYGAMQPYEGFDLPWGQYRSTDAVHRHELAMIGGEGKIVDRWGGIVERHTRAHMNKLNKDVFGDGYASGSERALKGLQSATGHTTASTAAGDKIAFPSDTYGGLSTALGNQGGTWSTDLSTSPNAVVDTDWPFGKGNTEYDFNSPVLVKTDSTAWDGSNDTWLLGCKEMIRYGNEAVKNLNGADMAGELLVMDGLSFAEMKQNFAGQFSVEVTQKRPGTDYGFEGEELNFEGITCTSDSDCPVGKRFLIQPSNFELFVLKSPGQKGMFYHSGPVWDQFQDSYTFQMGTLIQMKMKVKGLGMFTNFAHT
jgi:hypothetical protein